MASGQQETIYGNMTSSISSLENSALGLGGLTGMGSKKMMQTLPGPISLMKSWFDVIFLIKQWQCRQSSEILS